MGRRPELPQQHGAGGRALDQQGVRQGFRQPPADGAQVGVAGEQDERAPACGAQQAFELVRDCLGEPAAAGIRHFARQEQHGLSLEIELRRQPELLRAADAEPSPQVVERVVHGHRRRRQNGSLRAREDLLAHHAGHVDGGRPQEHAPLAALEKVDELVVAGGEQEPQLIAQFARAPRQRQQILRGVPDRAAARLELREALRQAGGPGRPPARAARRSPGSGRRGAPSAAAPRRTSAPARASAPGSGAGPRRRRVKPPGPCPARGVHPVPAPPAGSC